MVFAFLFGLSMDYEVFIITRVREEHERTRNTTRDLVEGLARTGRLVSCAALILFLAFASLASGPSTDLKVLATGLGVGIPLDATLIRALLSLRSWPCSAAGTGGFPGRSGAYSCSNRSTPRHPSQSAFR